MVPREVVLADIRQQVEAGARHITFGDPDFLNGPTHALAVARALHAEWPDVTFDVTAKIEHLLRHRAHLPELAAAGCLFIVSAAESLSDTVLAHLDKGHTRADIADRARGHARGRHHAAAHVGGLHAVDHARRLPRAGSTSSRRRS